MSEQPQQPPQPPQQPPQQPQQPPQPPPGYGYPGPGPYPGDPNQGGYQQQGGGYQQAGYQQAGYQQPGYQQGYPQGGAYPPPPGGYPPPGGFYTGDPSAPYGYDRFGRPYSDKSKIVAGVLQLLLGSLGIGRFYIGNVGIGIAQLFTCGGFGIWALIDGIIILTSDNTTDSDGRVLRSG
ncbi:TM2 domain-containing protein [Streptomyces sp. NPDC023723]|uniref:TM2 domain-containing protein n=1 Tax=Streptomyces sp. NPDC023723 TaxID=3154323 RepID=UPI0033E4A5DF